MHKKFNANRHKRLKILLILGYVMADNSNL